MKWDLKKGETEFKELKEKYDKKKAKWKRYKTCLNQAKSGLGSLHEQLEETQAEVGKWGSLWNLASKSEMRNGAETRNQDLTQLLKDTQLKY